MDKYRSLVQDLSECTKKSQRCKIFKKLKKIREQVYTENSNTISKLESGNITLNDVFILENLPFGQDNKSSSIIEVIMRMSVMSKIYVQIPYKFLYKKAKKDTAVIYPWEINNFL